MHVGPLVFDEVLEARPWGGRALARRAGKRLPPGVPVGESWEISDRNVVRSGPLAGRTLGDLVRTHSAQLLGRRRAEAFPLLVKLIDAQEWLSVQVHPDDTLARRLALGPWGKTEAWYILSAASGAEMISGVRPGGAARLGELARSGEIAGYLRRARPRTGDAWYCPAGAVHALGPGLLVLEVQQNSDLTFRLYDWGRKGLDGRPRALHVEESLRAAGDGSRTVSRCTGRALRGLGFPARRRVACEKFVMDEWRIARPVRRHKGRAFEILHVVEGAGVLRDGLWPEARLRRGTTVLMPAGVAEYEVLPSRGLRIIRAAEGE